MILIVLVMPRINIIEPTPRPADMTSPIDKCAEIATAATAVIQTLLIYLFIYLYIEKFITLHRLNTHGDSKHQTTNDIPQASEYKRCSQRNLSGN